MLTARDVADEAARLGACVEGVNWGRSFSVDEEYDLQVIEREISPEWAYQLIRLMPEYLNQAWRLTLLRVIMREPKNVSLIMRLISKRDLTREEVDAVEGYVSTTLARMKPEVMRIARRAITNV